MMMNLRIKPGIASHNTSNLWEVPCLSMRIKQRQRQTAPQVFTSHGDKEKSGGPDDHPHLEHKDISMTKRRTARNLSDVWREVQGSNNWEGMLEPMDHLLRSELIKYGEFAQACYDAFDFDHDSKYCGSCKYNRSTILQDVGLSHTGYEITKYLYATTNINLPTFFKKSPAGEKLWSNHANWMGFVAVAEDEQEIKKLGRRDILIAWRGTATYLEWLADLMDFLIPVGFHSDHPDSRVKVESGFLNLYTASQKDCRFAKSSAHEQIHAEIRSIIEKYKGEKLSITITGHSLGSALAMLSAYDIAEMGINQDEENGNEKIPITVFSFAGPRVGNPAFKEHLERLGIKILRVVNAHDVVPKVPGILFNEHSQSVPWSYSHVGVELELDHTKSPFLRPTRDPSCFHNLEAHLHLLDGYHGREEPFQLASGRDPALVNKAANFLQDQLNILPCWRQDPNKGMVRNSQGRWVQPQRSQSCFL
ncbi:hypothetical protein SUGI_0993910 [Cryptomeria japonica]|uniref:phospholipase A1-Igamma3, chloroplastic-like n=1 Tax=Cryptomeria japonica TaxID=3369 RepID=UPI0024146892|nr:phospholipase A1-Igamma3, chloroplastic-like [Cryptomeria japonica]GLJ47081.1 hypothetical protein SUGI_0993910 [Cryptomeria japonica]